MTFFPEQFSKKLFNPLSEDIRWGASPEAAEEKKKYLVISILIGLGTAGLAHLAYGTVRLLKHVKKLLQSNTSIQTTINKDNKIEVTRNAPKTEGAQSTLSKKLSELPKGQPIRFNQDTNTKLIKDLNQISEPLSKLPSLDREKTGKLEWKRSEGEKFSCTLYLKHEGDPKTAQAEKSVLDRLNSPIMTANAKSQKGNLMSVECTTEAYTTQAYLDKLASLQRTELEKAKNFFNAKFGGLFNFTADKDSNITATTDPAFSGEELFDLADSIEKSFKERFPDFKGFTVMLGRPLQGEENHNRDEKHPCTVVIHSFPLRAFYHQHIKSKSDDEFF